MIADSTFVGHHVQTRHNASSQHQAICLSTAGFWTVGRATSRKHHQIDQMTSLLSG